MSIGQLRELLKDETIFNELPEEEVADFAAGLNVTRDDRSPMEALRQQLHRQEAELQESQRKGAEESFHAEFAAKEARYNHVHRQVVRRMEELGFNIQKNQGE